MAAFTTTNNVLVTGSLLLTGETSMLDAYCNLYASSATFNYVQQANVSQTLPLSLVEMVGNELQLNAKSLELNTGNLVIEGTSYFQVSSSQSPSSDGNSWTQINFFDTGVTNLSATNNIIVFNSGAASSAGSNVVLVVTPMYMGIGTDAPLSPLTISSITKSQATITGSGNVYWTLYIAP